MTDTSIEWTHLPGYRGRTWNPTRGCSRVSPGCDQCYAMRQARRFDRPGGPYEGLTRIRKHDGAVDWSGKVVLVPSALAEPLRTRAPTAWFVNSMSDLFHESLSDEQIAAVFGVMAACPQHVFQVLTKRAQRMAEWFRRMERQPWPPAKSVQQRAKEVLHVDNSILDVAPTWPLPNVWLGVSVEDQPHADWRIPHLLRVPAAVRFLSVEPLLGPVDLMATRVGDPFTECQDCDGSIGGNCDSCCGLGRIDWVIVGGESGPGARPMHPDWARSIRDQCSAAGVPFFFKQWGAYLPLTPQYPGNDSDIEEALDGHSDRTITLEDNGAVPVDEEGRVEYQPRPEFHPWIMERVGKKVAGRLLDGREWSDFPEVHP